MKKFVLVACLVLSACARQMSPDEYDSDHVGQVENTYQGTIVHVRQVGVQGGDQLSDNALGGIGGGVAGGMIGSTIGHGTGSLFAQIGGVIAGATIGALTEAELKREKALEYIVLLDNGELKTIVQGTKPHLQEGQKVWVFVAQRGRSRILAQQN